jgi:formate-dependent nitrite reductase membrane component NrfD
MKQLGSILIILGVLFIIFDLSGCQNEKPSFLTDWMSNWGRNVEWAIKVGMVVLGMVLYFASGRRIK